MPGHKTGLAAMMESMLTVRQALAADAEGVAEVIRAAYVTDGYADPVRSPEYVAELLDSARRIREATVLIAESGGTVVGTVTCTSAPSPLANIARPGELEVRMLGVPPVMRGRGVAESLMHECARLAQRQNQSRIVLSTQSDMLAARRLYERLGYQRTPDRDWTVNGFPLITYGIDTPDTNT